MSEIKQLSEQKGGMSQNYEERYMEGITLIELTQSAKQQFIDEEVEIDEKRTILTELFEKMILRDGFVSVKYTKLAQAIARKSAQSREILAYGK